MHGLVVEFPVRESPEKKKLKDLHIVADEDHVAAQFWEKKGDLKISSAGNKINTIIDKIIVLFEDVVDDLIADIKRKQNGWDYADKLNTHVLGIEKPSMKWLRDIIDSKLA